MCNVAALTFYATIYEVVRGARDERRGEHVPGTAQHRWKFVFEEGGELTSPPTIIEILLVPTLFCTVCLCSIGTPKLL